MSTDARLTSCGFACCGPDCSRSKDPTTPAPSVDEVMDALAVDIASVGRARLRAFFEAIGPEGRAAGMAVLRGGR